MVFFFFIVYTLLAVGALVANQKGITMTLSDALALFQVYLSSGGHSRATRHVYRNTLQNHLLPYLEDIDLSQITPANLTQFQQFHNQRVEAGEIKPDTLHQYIRNTKAFFNWLEANEYLDVSPARRLKLPNIPDKPPKQITDADLALIIGEAFRTPGWRDYAIVLFLAFTGCRVGGLVSLTKQNIHFDQNRALIFEKGGEPRLVPFNDEVRIALQTYALVRPRDQGDRFFQGRRGAALTASGVHQSLARLAKRAGVTGRFNPHAFRHAYAMRNLSNGMDIETISKLLGHKSTIVTKRHYARWTINILQKKYDEFDRKDVLKEHVEFLKALEYDQ